MWTITSDPKDMSLQEHWRTLKRRWHTAHRTLIRLAPHFRYFLVVEQTKKGYPHLHILTDTYIDWHRFQALLTASDFGKVLQFSRGPKDSAIRYATKYATKALLENALKQLPALRLWSSSTFFLPIVILKDPEGQWKLILLDLPYFKLWGSKASP